MVLSLTFGILAAGEYTFPYLYVIESGQMKLGVIKGGHCFFSKHENREFGINNEGVQELILRYYLAQFGGLHGV